MTRCTNPKCERAKALAVAGDPYWRLALCDLCLRLEVESLMAQVGDGPREEVA